MRRLSLPFVLAFTLLVALFGCGGRSGGGSAGGSNGGGGGPGGVKPGDSSLAPEAIGAALDAANVAFADIVNSTTDQSARSERMAAWLKTRPEFAASGTKMPGTVWGRLTNGHLYVALSTSIPGEENTGARGVPPSRAASTTSARVEAQEPTVPSSNQAHVLLSGDQSFYNPPNDEIADALRDHGYTVSQQKATVERLKSVSGDGVFYWDTHGGIGYDDRGNANYWNAWTADEATPTAILLNKADLDAGALTYCTAAYGRDGDGKIVMRTDFAITKGFILKYGWSFAERAFLFLNCCYSDASDMTADMIYRTTGGFGGVYGWSDAVSVSEANRAGRFAFDRMLGINREAPAETVPQRPFDSVDVYKEMVERGIDNDGKAFLAWRAVKPPCLVPSLERMEVAERIKESPLGGKTKLTLYGIFGDSQGEVKVGGVEIPVTSWTADKIECTPADLPGPGFAGDVTVVSKERVGNAVPLTQWNGTLTYDIDLIPAQAGTAHSQIVCDVVFRGDVHRYREHAGKEPLDPKPFDFRAAQGSTAKWTVTGAPPEGSSWSGPLTADLPFGLNGTANAPYGTGYVVSGNLDAKAGKTALSFSFLGCAAHFSTLIGTSGDMVTLRDQTLTALASGVGTDGYPKYSNNLALGYTTDDALILGQTFNGTFTVLNPKLKISELTATFAPDRDKGEDNGH